jgi:hypothetical protein
VLSDRAGELGRDKLRRLLALETSITAAEFTYDVEMLTVITSGAQAGIAIRKHASLFAVPAVIA